jgi:hypothetical protein
LVHQIDVAHDEHVAVGEFDHGIDITIVDRLIGLVRAGMADLFVSRRGRFSCGRCSRCEIA